MKEPTTPSETHELAQQLWNNDASDHGINALLSLANQIDALTKERDALAAAGKLALEALEDCRDVLYQVARGNLACSDAEGVGTTLPDVFAALKKAGVQ